MEKEQSLHELDDNFPYYVHIKPFIILGLDVAVNVHV